MSDDKYNIEDIVNFSSSENPLNVKNAVDSLMLSKIHAAIEAKKLEVAKTMFGGTSEPEIEFEDEEWDDEEEDEDDDEDDFDISDDDLEDLFNDLEDLNLDDDIEDEDISDSEEE